MTQFHFLVIIIHNLPYVLFACKICSKIINIRCCLYVQVGLDRYRVSCHQVGVYQVHVSLTFLLKMKWAETYFRYSLIMCNSLQQNNIVSVIPPTDKDCKAYSIRGTPATERKAWKKQLYSSGLRFPSIV